jgi:hypothetical protein
MHSSLSSSLGVTVTGGPTARLAWAGARARRLWALKAKYTSTGGEATGEGARGTGTSACYLDFVSCPGLSNFLGPPLVTVHRKRAILIKLSHHHFYLANYLIGIETTINTLLGVR